MFDGPIDALIQIGWYNWVFLVFLCFWPMILITLILTWLCVNLWDTRKHVMIDCEMLNCGHEIWLWISVWLILDIVGIV